MRYSNAVRLYFSKTPQSAGVLRKIMRWDARLSVEKNCHIVKISNATSARRFAEKFGLKFRGYGRRKTPLQIIKARGIEKLRNMGYTLDQIGRLHGISRQRIEQLLRRWRSENKRGKSRGSNRLRQQLNTRG